MGNRSFTSKKWNRLLLLIMPMLSIVAGESQWRRNRLFSMPHNPPNFPLCSLNLLRKPRVVFFPLRLGSARLQENQRVR
jgi:hypothetical protein